MVSGVLVVNSNGVFGFDCGSFGKKRIVDLGFNIFDFFNGLFFGEIVKKKIDIWCRWEFFVVEFVKCFFVVVVFSRYW